MKHQEETIKAQMKQQAESAKVLRASLEEQALARICTSAANLNHHYRQHTVSISTQYGQSHSTGC